MATKSLEMRFSAAFNLLPIPSLSTLILLMFYLSMHPGVEALELTEEHIRKAGIVPSKKALEILKNSIPNKTSRDDSKGSFREARFNSQLKINYKLDMDKTINEMCAVSSTLICGKKVLLSLDRAEDDGKNIHDRCTARQEFLECLGSNREMCRDLAKKNELPYLPPDSVIRDTQSKISQALWTSGGCLLS